MTYIGITDVHQIVSDLEEDTKQIHQGNEVLLVVAKDLHHLDAQSEQTASLCDRSRVRCITIITIIIVVIRWSLMISNKSGKHRDSS